MSFPLLTFQVHTPALNYIGLVLALVSLSMYTLVKSEVGGDDEEGGGAGGEGGHKKRLIDNVAKGDYMSIGATASPRIIGNQPYRELGSAANAGSVGKQLDQLANSANNAHQQSGAVHVHVGSDHPELDLPADMAASLLEGTSRDDDDVEGVNFIDRLPRAHKRWLGIVGAMLSGIFYGSNFDPPQVREERRGKRGRGKRGRGRGREGEEERGGEREKERGGVAAPPPSVSRVERGA